MEVSFEKVKNCLLSAPTGSNYWGNAAELGYDSAYPTLLAGGKVEIQDEETAKCHPLTWIKLKAGLVKMSKECPEILADIMNSCGDQHSADTLLQYALFNEVRYN